MLRISRYVRKFLVRPRFRAIPDFDCNLKLHLPRSHPSLGGCELAWLIRQSASESSRRGLERLVWRAAPSCLATRPAVSRIAQRIPENFGCSSGSGDRMMFMRDCPLTTELA